jgi:hypothetical protein
MESLGHLADEDGDADLYVASVPSFGVWPRLAADPIWKATVEESPDGFAVFFACDATALSARLIGEFASYCIDHGLFWVSAWGPDCERVHDIFDEFDIAQDRHPGIVMTAWHDDESLDDALVLFWSAFPGEGKPGGPARVAVSVGSDEWLDGMRRAASNSSRMTTSPSGRCR